MTNEFKIGDIVECTYDGYSTLGKGTRGRVIKTGLCNNGDQFIRMEGVGMSAWSIDETIGYRSCNFELILAASPKAIDRSNWKKFIAVGEFVDEDGSLFREQLGAFKSTDQKAKTIAEDFVRAESKVNPEFKKLVLFQAVEEFEIAPVPVKSRKLK